jgi:hypothetical protein
MVNQRAVALEHGDFAHVFPIPSKQFFQLEASVKGRMTLSLRTSARQG